MSRRRPMSVEPWSGVSSAGPSGVRGAARSHGSVRNRRDPSWRSTLDEGGSHKPMAKGNRAGRESEGFVVPLTPADKAGRGKGPCFGRVGVGR